MLLSLSRALKTMAMVCIMEIYPVAVEDIGPLWKLRITALLKELPKEELSLTWMCLAREVAFSHNIKIAC